MTEQLNYEMRTLCVAIEKSALLTSIPVWLRYNALRANIEMLYNYACIEVESNSRRGSDTEVLDMVRGAHNVIVYYDMVPSSTDMTNLVIPLVHEYVKEVGILLNDSHMMEFRDV